MTTPAGVICADDGSFLQRVALAVLVRIDEHQPFRGRGRVDVQVEVEARHGAGRREFVRRRQPGCQRPAAASAGARLRRVLLRADRRRVRQRLVYDRPARCGRACHRRRTGRHAPRPARPSAGRASAVLPAASASSGFARRAVAGVRRFGRPQHRRWRRRLPRPAFRGCGTSPAARSGRGGRGRARGRGGGRRSGRRLAGRLPDQQHADHDQVHEQQRDRDRGPDVAARLRRRDRHLGERRVRSAAGARARTCAGRRG